MKNKKLNIKYKKAPVKWVVCILIVLLVIILFKSFTGSLFFSNKDRENLVIYGENPTYYSIGRTEKIHYIASFYPDYRMTVPGGYGDYRAGALGKLVKLEKNPLLFLKTFSLSTQTFVGYSFYENDGKIYYGKGSEGGFENPVKKIILSSSTANVFDRLYLTFFFFGKRKSDFTVLSFEKKEGSPYQGYLYHKSYRRENKSIQVTYTKTYETASKIAGILEGNGIKVADLTEDKKGGGSRCVVKEESDTFSTTALDTASFFGCSLQKGRTGLYDILFESGNLEKEWE